MTHVTAIRVFAANLQRLAGAQPSVGVEQRRGAVAGANTVDETTDPAGADREGQVDEVTGGERRRVRPLGIRIAAAAHVEYLVRRQMRFNDKRESNTCVKAPKVKTKIILPPALRRSNRPDQGISQ